MANAKKKDELGSLKRFGLDNEWEIPLLMPRTWERVPYPMKTYPYEGQEVESNALIELVVNGDPQVVTRGTRRVSFTGKDANGTFVKVTAWGSGPQSVYAGFRRGDVVTLAGTFGYFNGRPDFSVSEYLPKKAIGKLRPVYPGKSPKTVNGETAKRGGVKPERVRDMMTDKLSDSIPKFKNEINKRLKVFGNVTKIIEELSEGAYSQLDDVIRDAHFPVKMEDGLKAQTVMHQLAALESVSVMLDETAQIKVDPIKLSKKSMLDRIAMLPFTPTNDQVRAIEDIAQDLRRPVSMRRMLTGDVGTGKTAVIGVTAAMVADAGLKTAIMLPKTTLASQIFEELSTSFPDLDIRLVPAKKGKTVIDYSDADIVVGTTSLLFAEIGKRDYTIIDEQQQFSKAQREELASGTHGVGHMLESSATCIPRSQALVTFGMADSSQLRESPVDKTIRTHIHFPEDKQKLLQTCIDSVKDGYQFAAVYACRDKEAEFDEDGKRINMVSAEEGAKTWEKHFPGRVKLLHGAMKVKEKNDGIKDMKDGKYDVLASTTMIEVGLTLPKLYTMLVSNGERYGLTTLHQLRGRLARKGGVGDFHIYIGPDATPEAIDRLVRFSKTTDGFAVAEEDLRTRGMGELAGEEQKGDADSILINHKLTYDDMNSILPIITRSIKRPEPIAFIDEPQAEKKVIKDEPVKDDFSMSDERISLEPSGEDFNNLMDRSFDDYGSENACNVVSAKVDSTVKQDNCSMPDADDEEKIKAGLRVRTNKPKRMGFF